MCSSDVVYGMCCICPRAAPRSPCSVFPNILCRAALGDVGPIQSAPVDREFCLGLDIPVILQGIEIMVVVRDSDLHRPVNPLRLFDLPGSAWRLVPDVNTLSRHFAYLQRRCAESTTPLIPSINAFKYNGGQSAFALVSVMSPHSSRTSKGAVRDRSLPWSRLSTPSSPPSEARLAQTP